MHDERVEPTSPARRNVDLPHVTPIAEVVDRLAQLLDDGRAGFFTDFDGTLSLLAPTPDAATIEPAAALALRELATRIEVVGIVTGRAAADARERVGIEELLYVGNHGLEWAYRGDHGDHPAGVAAERVLESALEAIRQRLESVASLDGVIFENKRLSGSVHYRLSEDPETVGQALAEIAQEAAAAAGLRLTSGKMVLELRPEALVNKGTAIEDVIARHRLDAALFIGDDVTDVDGFEALHRVAAQTGKAVCAIGVLTADTASGVIDSSDLLLDGVAGVVATLESLNRRLRTSGRRPERKGA